jgi:hypothetical protein
MLTKEQFLVFLALLAAFAKANGLSAASASRVLGVSHQTTVRWLAEARRASKGEDVASTAYTYLVDPVIEKIEKLNAIDKERGLYAAIAREKNTQKEEILHGALDGRAV